MSKPSLLVIGAGGHARACIDVIEQEGRFQIAGLVGLSAQVGTNCFDHEVIGTDDDLGEFATRYSHALIAVGQVMSAEPREHLYKLALSLGFQLPTIIAPTAYVSPRASIGAGTIIMHGAVINAGATIGNNCIINSNALVEHGSRVDDHCHISTGAILNGDVLVGTKSFIGSGSVVKEGTAIGAKSLIGMGTTVRHDISTGTKHVGGDA